MSGITPEVAERGRAAVLGALVADAAALGLHWLYDTERLAEVAGKQPEFRPPTAEDFDGYAGYFAHAARHKGDVSQYGEQCLVMLRSLARNQGQYNKFDYQSEFINTFGYGGTYTGYIDRPTRNTLNALEAAGEEASENPDRFYGDDDDQLPAVSKLPH